LPGKTSGMPLRHGHAFEVAPYQEKA